MLRTTRRGTAAGCAEYTVDGASLSVRTRCTFAKECQSALVGYGRLLTWFLSNSQFSYSRSPSFYSWEISDLCPVSTYLERDDNETDEDVHHEEGDDHNERDEEQRNSLPRVVHRSTVFFVRIDRHIQQAKTGMVHNSVKQQKLRRSSHCVLTQAILRR